MEINEIEVDKITADPNQPRKYIDKDSVERLARSIAQVGVINAIELDEDLMIVTGELRWRAAKIAGLKTIPARIIKIEPKERFIRQLSDNLNQSVLSNYEIDSMLDRLLALDPDFKNGEILKDGPDADKKISMLVEEVGLEREQVESWLHNLKNLEKYRKIQELRNQIKTLNKS